ncbi:hypothetical protein [uncultured Campylobacter sp.]|uniref:hypothetical protein n=1 Tax=uncultured Campylobacter sp. TaxID=218934 RepID=UPI0028E363E3|nr:hypothetical protein [uncultured Campylobacter sp.]
MRENLKQAFYFPFLKVDITKNTYRPKSVKPPSQPNLPSKMSDSSETDTADIGFLLILSLF